MVTALSELDDIAGRPVIDRDVVYAISHSGVMAATSAANTGERLWTRDIGGTQTPWAAGDYVYVLDRDDRVLCLTRKEGQVRWVHQLPQYDDPEKGRSHHLGRAGAGLQQADRHLFRRLMPRRSRPITASCWAGWKFPAAPPSRRSWPTARFIIYTNDAELVALRYRDLDRSMRV